MRPYYEYLGTKDKKQIFRTPKGILEFFPRELEFRKDMLKYFSNEDHLIDTPENIADMLAAYETCPRLGMWRFEDMIKEEIVKTKKKQPLKKWDYDRTAPKELTDPAIILF